MAMSEKKQRLLTKGNYTKGLKCEKLLWYLINKSKDPAIFSPTSPATQLLFDQGHEVGALARKLYKGAIEIEWNKDPDVVMGKSIAALKTGKTVLEAGFYTDETYSIADVLKPVKGKKDVYDLTEVKMGASPKDYYYDDIAFQKYNFTQYGIKIRNCYLKHVNKEYVYQGGEIDLDNFFVEDINVNEEVKARLPEIPKTVKKFREMIAKKTPPDIRLGLYCEDGGECDLLPFCMKDVPKGSVLTLHGKDREERFKYYYDDKKKLILELPKHELSKKHEMMYDALKDKEAKWDKEKISEFLDTIDDDNPIYYLDFETLMNLAVPKFKGTRPYQQIPFQFSLHIQEKKGGPVTHKMFLAEGKADPRPECIEKLDEWLGTEGTILTYKQSMEQGVIKDLARDFPKFKGRAENFLSRIKDLLVPFRGFAYYHPDQEGSASLKDVLPAMTGITYEGMDLSAGGDAGAKFIEVTFKDASAEERAKVRKALIDYCTQDTMAMVEILEKLEAII